jgi:hypothetical protein
MRAAKEKLLDVASNGFRIAIIAQRNPARANRVTPPLQERPRTDIECV